jgi:hypothetical protein
MSQCDVPQVYHLRAAQQIAAWFNGWLIVLTPEDISYAAPDNVSRRSTAVAPQVREVERRKCSQKPERQQQHNEYGKRSHPQSPYAD